MGLWDMLGKAANAVYDGAKSTTNEINEKYNEFSALSDKELLVKSKSGIITTAVASKKVLMDRGYTEEAIRRS